MSILQRLCIGVLLLVHHCESQATGSDDNLFIWPGAPGPLANFVGNEAWALGSPQNVQWSTNISTYEIWLYQQQLDPPTATGVQPICTATDGADSRASISWTVTTYSTNLTFSPVYFLWLLDADGNGFTSHYFNITDPASSSVSSTISSSTAIAVSSTTTSSIPTTSTSSTRSTTTPITSSTASSIMLSSTSTVPDTSSASSTNPATEMQNSEARKALSVGLGTGLGIGIPLVLLIGVWLGMKSMKRSREVSGSGLRPGSPHGKGDDKIWTQPSLPPAAPPIYEKQSSSQSYSHSWGAPAPHQDYHEAPAYEIYEAPNKSQQSPVEIG